MYPSHKCSFTPTDTHTLIKSSYIHTNTIAQPYLSHLNTKTCWDFNYERIDGTSPVVHHQHFRKKNKMCILLLCEMNQTHSNFIFVIVDDDCCSHRHRWDVVVRTICWDYFVMQMKLFHNSLSLIFFSPSIVQLVKEYRLCGDKIANDEPRHTQKNPRHSGERECHVNLWIFVHLTATILHCPYSDSEG